MVAISDLNCTGSDLGINTTVIVDSPSIADFSYITENLTTSFTNNSQNTDTYLWNFGDGNLSINVNPVHTYLTENNYEVVLTATNSLCGSNEYSQTINITTAIFNLDGEGFIKLSPNPTNGIILLEIENIKSNQIFIEIININGQAVYKELYISQFLKEQIDLSEQPSGIYLIKIKADNFTKTMKLLKE